MIYACLYLCLRGDRHFDACFSLITFSPRIGYHWDTSDWMPSAQRPVDQELLQSICIEKPAPSCIDPDPELLNLDCYVGGIDIESDSTN
jgi:hypothetical protein